MTITEYKQKFSEKWDSVRPVVIYFAGERFVVEYDREFHPRITPFVAMVHSLFGNTSALTEADH